MLCLSQPYIIIIIIRKLATRPLYNLFPSWTGPMKQGSVLCSAWRGSEAIKCLSSFGRVLVSASCQPSKVSHSVKAIPMSQPFCSRRPLKRSSISVTSASPKEIPPFDSEGQSETSKIKTRCLKYQRSSQIMKLLFLTGNNLYYDFCIIEAMFGKAMFLGGLVTVSTETSFNATVHVFSSDAFF